MSPSCFFYIFERKKEMTQNNKKKRARNLAALGVTGAAIFKILKAVNADKKDAYELWADCDRKRNQFGLKFINPRTKKEDGYYWTDIDEAIEATDKILSSFKYAKEKFNK